MRHIRKPKPVSAKLPVILYDKQEKHPWTFLKQYDYEMERAHLKVGDYTLKGFEDKLSIEKKSGLEELFHDLTARYRETFKRFLVKLSKVPIKVIVVEGDLSDIAKILEVVRRKSGGNCQLTQETIYYWVSKIILDYKIPIIFTGNNWISQVHIVKHLIIEAHSQCLR